MDMLKACVISEQEFAYCLQSCLVNPQFYFRKENNSCLQLVSQNITMLCNSYVYVYFCAILASRLKN